jgi:hypothetical protein
MLNLQPKALPGDGVNGAGNVLKIRNSYKVNRELPRPFAGNHLKPGRISIGYHAFASGVAAVPWR